MSVVEKIDIASRRNAVPIIYTRGTHYEIGFDIVSLIMLSKCLFNFFFCQ